MRLLALLFSLLVMSAAVTACGDDSGTVVEGDDPPVENEATPEATAEPEATPETGADVATVEGVRVSGASDVDAEPTVVVPTGDEPPGELVTEDLVEGDGEVVREGDQVSVQYTGIGWSTGEKFDASWDRGAEPFTFTVGEGGVIEGWDRGVEGMRVGGRRLLIIPPELGYGAAGQAPVIAPDETLVFVVDAVEAG